MIWDSDVGEWVGPDPLHDREPNDGELAMSMFDPNEGWLDAP